MTGTRKVDAAAANAMTWPDSVFSQTHYAGVQASFQNVPVSAGQDKPLPAAPRGAAAPGAPAAPAAPAGPVDTKAPALPQPLRPTLEFGKLTGPEIAGEQAKAAQRKLEAQAAAAEAEKQAQENAAGTTSQAVVMRQDGLGPGQTPQAAEIENPRTLAVKVGERCAREASAVHLLAVKLSTIPSAALVKADLDNVEKQLLASCPTVMAYICIYKYICNQIQHHQPSDRK